MQDATTTARCLTRLADLTSWSLLLRLWPTALRVARLVGDFQGNSLSAEGMLKFELELQRLLWAIGRIIIEWRLNCLERKEQAKMPIVYWEGNAYRPKRLSPFRSLNCLFGPIRVERWLYESMDGLQLAALFPLERMLGMVAGVATPALADLAAQLSVDFTQRQVLESLRQRNHVCWGVSTLRNVVQAMAEGIAPYQHAARVEKVLGWLKQASETAGPVRVALAVGRDGLMLPIRGKDTYKEAATASVSIYSRWGKRLGTLYLGQMPEPGQGTLSDELTQLLRDVLSQWQGAAPRLVYITDAGFHPNDYFEKVLCRMLDPHCLGRYLEWEWTVDYYHACGYLSKLGEAIFGPGRAAHFWAAKMRRLLKDKPGGIHRVLRSAGALKTIRGLVGAEKDYDSAYGFLQRHARWMDYAARRRRRTPIGSGVTEAACKIVFSQRFKCSGMKWKEEGGAAILALRVAVLSKTWSTVRNRMFASWQTATARTPGQNRLIPLGNAA